MKNALIIGITALFAGCAVESSPTEAEIEQEIIKTFNELYEAYAGMDVDKFSAFYKEDVIRMGTSGSHRIGRESFVEHWKNSFANTEMVLLDYSQPTILVGKDQTVTFNTYEELFIDRETRDTTFADGTWIGIWQKQEDESWKLRMTTWH